MDRLESMSTLLAAVEAGSLSAASRKLGMPLATVSRKVSELEAHLRTRLINRTSRRLTLTDAGRSYVAACKRILEDIGEAERAAAGEYMAPRGDLIITAPIVFGRLHVLPVAIEFLKAYPDIDIRLALADRVVNLQEEMSISPSGSATCPTAVLLRPASAQSAVWSAAARIILPSEARRRSPRELSTHDCITFEGLTSPDAWKFAVGKSTVSVAIHSRLIVNTAEAAIDAAIAGLGLRASSRTRSQARSEPARLPLHFESSSRSLAGQSRLQRGGCCRSSCAPFSISRRRA